MIQYGDIPTGWTSGHEAIMEVLEFADRIRQAFDQPQDQKENERNVLQENSGDVL